MKIYTKSGDQGQTGLLGGVRVSKDDLRIRSYGGFDELNAVLGVVLAESTLSAGLKGTLARLQRELFQLGAELATPRGRKPSSALLGDPDIERLEKEIDAMEATLPKLLSFVLPTGPRAAALLHLARTVCRRAERDLVSFNRAEPQRPEVLRYANRLSDHLFVCARAANAEAGGTDLAWP